MLPDMPEPDRHDHVEQRTLVTIAHFTDLMSAQLAMTVLESTGIPAFLRNENMVRLGWAPGVGGIDVQVEPENEAAAKEILEQPPENLIAGDDDPDPPAGA